MSRNTWVISESSPTVASEIDEFIHKHTLLVSVISASSKTLHLFHWPHNSSSTPFFMTTTLSIEDLRFVAAFRERCVVPISSSSFSSHDSETLLSSLAGKTHFDGPQRSDSCESTVQQIVAQLPKFLPAEGFSSSSQESTKLDLYSVEVRTRAEDGLNDTGLEEMVWKWAKPNSPYQKGGCWCSTIEEVVADGVWGAGKVEKWKKEVMFQGGSKPVTILSDEEFENRRYLIDSESMS